MPGKSWILQYSVAAEEREAPNRGGNQVVYLSGETLTPPWPEKKFDFRRPAIERGAANRTIVLHGRIQEDGAVQAIKVHRGVQQNVDLLALAAFQQWKFRPATRAGKPVAVEILVGIPAEIAGLSQNGLVSDPVRPK
jgi:hypothetical protein